MTTGDPNLEDIAALVADARVAETLCGPGDGVGPGGNFRVADLLELADRHWRCIRYLSNWASRVTDGTWHDEVGEACSAMSALLQEIAAECKRQFHDEGDEP